MFLDSGAQLFTMTGTLYKKHLMLKVELVDISHMLRVICTQAVEVPFLGYFEVDAKILSEAVLCNMVLHCASSG